MAELDVQPKQGTPWWLWLLIALGLIALIFFLMRGCDDDRVETAAVTETTTADSNSTIVSGWDGVDFYAPVATYDEVSDPNVEVRENDNYAIYAVDETVLFDLDESTLRSSAEQALQQVAQSVKNRYANAEIRVYGHTDALGSADYNMELGRERAASVRDFMVQNGSVQADRISTDSEGETEPVATNATPAGRQQNRRVEIVVRRNT